MSVDPNVDPPASRAIRARLEENIEELSAELQAFGRVITFFGETSGTKIRVNWIALVAAGIDRNTPVTVSLRDVPFRNVLATVLSVVGGGMANLDYTIDDGVIVISTRDDLDSQKYQVFRVYDIRNILPASGVDHHLQNIIDTIKTTIAPCSWRDAGGNVGSIRELNGKLIINQTRDTHGKIGDLLNQLREEQTLPNIRNKGKRWMEVQTRAEKIVRQKKRFPGVRELCRLCKCSPDTLTTAIKRSRNLTARKAEYDQRVKAIDLNDTELARLTAESNADNEAHPSPVRNSSPERLRTRPLT